MKGLKEFKIDIFNLSQKQHEFRFEISDTLFALHENSIVEKGRGSCLLFLSKSETMMTLRFVLDAEVELVCDRSLDKFWYPVKREDEIIIKFGDDNYSLSEDVLVIKNDTASINVGDYIYEFINLGVPMKKLHPRYQDEDEQDSPDLIYTSQPSESDNPDGEGKDIDPRWEALKKIKKK